MQPIQIVNEGFIEARRKEREARRARKRKASAAPTEGAVQSDADGAAEQPNAKIVTFGRAWVPPGKKSLQILSLPGSPGLTKAKSAHAGLLGGQFGGELRILYAAIGGVVAGAGLLGIILAVYGIATGSLSKWVEML